MKIMDQTSSAAKFLLGGIGTGTISLDHNARLCDFELWNAPNKGFRSPYSFFAVRTETSEGEVKTKALESRLMPPFPQGHGFHIWELGGLPRFEHSEMTGEYPFIRYLLTDAEMPVEARLEAFTPFIPLNTDDSSLPVAMFRYSIKNLAREELTVSVAGSMANLCNLSGQDAWTNPQFSGEYTNRFVDQGSTRGIHYVPLDRDESVLNYFEMALLTPDSEGVSHLDYWGDGTWWDELQDFWSDFTEDGALTPGRIAKGLHGYTKQPQIPMASVCIKKRLAPGEEAQFPFVISWYRPNRVRSWDKDMPVSDEHPIIRNYYAKFGPALMTADYLVRNLARLEGDSRKFADALRSSTLPESVIDAVSANITVIRSNTCFRIEDGTFFGWEGCHDKEGSCAGNCTHVWNYTQTMAFLFPELERSMRETEFLRETDDDGYMAFRAYRALGDARSKHPPAADGQLGTIVRLYRDWKLCGDDVFLKTMWRKAKLALEYACTHWDPDEDGLLDGQQHNTYDIEFFGVSSMINSIFFAALRAGEEISRYLGDETAARRYSDLHARGARKLDALSYNGEYYEQRIADVDEYKYQYGKGCLADQLLGQQLAHVSGLGYLMDPAHIKSAVRAVHQHNLVRDFRKYCNLQRTYALNGDGGLVLCTWPRGDRPKNPFTYCDEVWTGIEYQVASHLIYEGFVNEGLEIVEACRARYNGSLRSPWNEVECGHHYARSLASYAVLLALSGFRCDAVNKTLTFNPAMNADEFSCFFCCADGWGLYHQTHGVDGQLNRRIETLHGDLSGYRLA